MLITGRRKRWFPGRHAGDKVDGPGYATIGKVDFRPFFLLLFCNYRGLTEEIFDKGNEVTEENGFYGFKNIV